MTRENYNEVLDSWENYNKVLDAMSDFGKLMVDTNGYNYTAGYLQSFLASVVLTANLSDDQTKIVLNMIQDRINRLKDSSKPA